MSITVSFTSSSKKINSTMQLAMTDSYNCNLKSGCSILRPTLFLELNTNSFPTYTAFKIENRYYKITDIRSVRNNLFEVDGVVDALATYKAEIGSSTQYIIRSSAQYNPYVIDKKYPALADSDLSTLYLDGLATDNEGSYVLGVIGIGESQGTVKYYAFPAFFMERLLLALFDDGNLDNGSGFIQTISLEVQKELFNPFQYIVSCNWYPIPYSYFNFTANAEIVHFGWWEAKYSIEGETYTLSGARVKEDKRIYSWEQTFNPPKHPQAPTRGTFLNDSPYTRYMLNCYTFGSIPLNPSPFVDGDAGAIELDVDLFAGMAQLYVTTSSGRLFTTSAQFGVPIQISQTTSNVIGATVSAVEAGVGVATGNEVQAVKGIASAIESIFPMVKSTGGVGSKAAFMQRANITAEFRSIAPELNANLGRPLCDAKVISSIPGYIECENVAIDLAATEEEKRQVISFMEQGFFYE